MACGCCRKETQNGLPGIKKDRWPTDILFLALFIVSFAVLVAIFQLAVAAGADVDRILRATDMDGNICGSSNATLHQPYGVWPDPTQYSFMICVEDCNYTSSCSSRRMSWRYDSTPYLGAYCLPITNETFDLAVSLSGSEDSSIMSAFDSASEMFSRAISDINAVSGYLGYAPLTAIVCAFIFTIVLKFFAGFLTFLCLMFIVVCAAFLGYSLYTYSPIGLADGTLTETEAEYVIYFAYGILIADGIFLLALFFLREQLKIAVAIVKETAQAIGDMKLIILFPFIPAGLLLAYGLLWLYGAVFFASVLTLVSGVEVPDSVKVFGPGFESCPELLTWAWEAGTVNLLEVPNDQAWRTNITVYERDTEWEYYGAYTFFHLLWNIQFFFYMGYLVFAGATADWYFTPRDPNGNKIRGKDGLPHFAITASCCRSVKYHLGTVALCALIIAIVQMIRYTLMYIEAQTKGDPPSRAQKAMFMAIQCCLKCLECCLDKLNRNALIWTSIWGDGFFTAACAAFMLLFRNLARVAAINLVAGSLLILAKFAVALMNASAFYALFSYALPDIEISSPLAPCAVVFAMSFGVAAIFMGVFNAMIDTIFLCFLVDAENNGTHMLASESLQKIVGRYEEESKEVAAGIKRRAGARPDTKGGSRDEGNKIQVQPKEA